MATSAHPGARAALLLLADARFPTGAHAHSSGVEAAHAAGDITDLDHLRTFVAGRLATVGRVDAAFAAAACAPDAPWSALERELAARTPSPRLRATSRALGRQLLRAGERAWPSPLFITLRAAVAGAAGPPGSPGSGRASATGPHSGSQESQGSPGSSTSHAAPGSHAPPGSRAPRASPVLAGPMQPIALGAVAAAAGLAPVDAALCALHHLVGTASTAAIRLLGLDPFATHALAADLADELERRATEAADAAGGPLDELPSSTSPLGDIGAEHHATWEVRLFAS